MNYFLNQPVIIIHKIIKFDHILIIKRLTLKLFKKSNGSIIDIVIVVVIDQELIIALLLIIIIITSNIANITITILKFVLMSFSLDP